VVNKQAPEQLVLVVYLQTHLIALDIDFAASLLIGAGYGTHDTPQAAPSVPLSFAVWPSSVCPTIWPLLVSRAI